MAYAAHPDGHPSLLLLLFLLQPLLLLHGPVLHHHCLTLLVLGWGEEEGGGYKEGKLQLHVSYAEFATVYTHLSCQL